LTGVPEVALPGADRRRATVSISRSRRVRSRLWRSVSALALLLVVAPVVWVLEGVLQAALPHWHWSVLTTVTTGVGGGLSNALAGTGVLLLGVGIVVAVVGVGCGLYLAEIAPSGPVTAVLRGASEVLSGVPSIVFGYVGYVALVVGLHWGYSLLAAVIVLSMLVVPYVAKSTEIALAQVPVAYREGAEALGIARLRMLRTVVLRSAIPGMATGVIVALAISVGETAPMLYTAGFSNSYPSSQLVHSAVPYLTYASFSFWDEPGSALKALSSDASFLLVVIVLALILVSRLVVRLTQRHAPERALRGAGTREVKAARAHAARRSPVQGQ
jgi:phosphate transport system permease protein